MSSSRATGDKSLDDSLTNIQWLCELESSELLQSQRASKMKESAEDLQSRVSPSSPNPHPKPPYSYATMILLAINSTEDKRMTLQDIYKWIENNYPYYKKCKKAWKNSIRHNLSLHSFFLKEKRPVDLPGKGSYWSISPEGKKNIMREVMKHAQPVIQNPLIQTGSSGRNLRPILPKPLEDVPHVYNEGAQPAQKMPGVCSIVNGNTVMPVVILPTNVYMDLASKIANSKKASSGFTVTQGVDATIKVTGPKQHAETRSSSCSQGSGNVSVTALMDEILRNKNFAEVLDTIKTENENKSLKIMGNDTAPKVSNQQHGTYGTPAVVKQNRDDDSKLGSSPKKIKVETTKENVYKKLSLPCPVLHAMSHQHRSPLKDRTLPTLAAMNSENNDSFTFYDKEYKHQDITSSMLSPVQLNTPRASNITLKKSSTPAQSTSPLSSAFHSGLTPLKYDSDSGFFTPLRDSDFDFLLSPSQLNLQVTPARLVGSTPQRCRKSLRLGTVQEDADGNDILSWM